MEITFNYMFNITYYILVKVKHYTLLIYQASTGVKVERLVSHQVVQDQMFIEHKKRLSL